MRSRVLEASFEELGGYFWQAEGQVRKGLVLAI